MVNFAFEDFAIGDQGFALSVESILTCFGELTVKVHPPITAQGIIDEAIEALLIGNLSGIGLLLNIASVKQFINCHEWMMPANDEWVDGREVAQDEIEGKGVWFLVFGHREDAVRIAGENSGAGDAVDGLFGGLIAFTEMRAESDCGT